MLSSSAEVAILTFGLLAPLTAAGALWLMRPRSTGEAAGVSLAFLWTVPALFVTAAAAARFGWWGFHGGAIRFAGMPLELFLGWAFLWGPLAAMALSRCSIAVALAVCFVFDCAMMPLCAPVVVLGQRWLIGEAAALILILLPAQLLYRWTVEGRRL